MMRRLAGLVFQKRISLHNLRVCKNVSLRSCGVRFAASFKSSFQGQILYALNKKISFFIRMGRINEARVLFSEMELKDTVSWNSMISGYVRRREITKARNLFDEMPARDVVSWNLMISGYASCGGKKFLEEGRRLFDEMPERDVFSWNTMISGYSKNGRMDEAFQLFNRMPERDVVSWNAMVTGFLNNGDVVRAVALFARMPKRDSTSLCALVSGLVWNGKLDEAAMILPEFRNKSDEVDDLVHAYNTLIAGYGQRGKVGEARKLFDDIPVCNVQGKDAKRFARNVVSWNTMIMCYVKAGDIISARHLFDQMTGRDAFSWNTIIGGYVQVSDMEEALKLFLNMPNPDTPSWNTMISGYAQTGNLQLARYFFERVPQKNLVSWNIMIAGYEKNEDYVMAVNLFIQMLVIGEKPDRHTLSSILSVSAGMADLHLGMQIHQLVAKTVIPDMPINNALITMYSRCGKITEARSIFDEVKELKEVVSWNAMIGGYASHGYASKALEVFELMKKCEVKPTYITFISVLSACSHAGLVEQGRVIFKSMVKDHGIEPRVEHFASLVDMLGRQGQLEEALNTIKSMPVEPDRPVWGALLSASRVHNNIDMARVAAEALIRLEPESPAPYILLYNMYADVGQWDNAAEIRTMMERNDIKKKAASSCIDSFH